MDDEADVMLSDLPDDDIHVEAEFYEPDDDEIQIADEETQIDEMRKWFLARYCDPAEATPFESAEGGYMWIWGGPYEPLEELEDRFGQLVEFEIIERLAVDLRHEVGWEWASVRREEDYGDPYEFDTENPDDPLVRLKDRLAQALMALELQGNPEAMALVPNLVFGAAISTLEAFLWETVAYWIENDETVLRGVVTKMPDLKGESIKLGDIFDEHAGLKLRVRTYLQNLVWHRWDKVAQLFLHGFGFKTPSFKPFVAALVKRHHIVHRSGHDMDGAAIAVSAADCATLSSQVEEFAQEIHAQVAERCGTASFEDVF